jgi:murein DD-endopeptidase MepM/ murein hydrolase activator NlpD
MGKFFEGSSPGWGNEGYKNGPRFHAQRALGNWQSDNAWDVFGKEGTQINSLTDGTVAKVYQSSGNNPKIYGTQVTIRGKGEYPDVFYTHLKDVDLKIGDNVNVGDKVGKIEKSTTGIASHVHVGLPYGEHISGLVEKSGELKRDKEKSLSDAAATGAAVAATGAALTSKKDSTSTGTPDVLGAFAKDISGIAVPLGILGGISGLKEEVDRIKELLKP